MATIEQDTPVIGRLKEASTTTHLDHATASNYHQIIDDLVKMSKATNSSGFIKINFYRGGFQGLEIIEVRKIKP